MESARPPREGIAPAAARPPPRRAAKPDHSIEQRALLIGLPKRSRAHGEEGEGFCIFAFRYMRDRPEIDRRAFEGLQPTGCRIRPRLNGSELSRALVQSVERIPTLIALAAAVAFEPVESGCGGSPSSNSGRHRIVVNAAPCAPRDASRRGRIPASREPAAAARAVTNSLWTRTDVLKVWETPPHFGRGVNLAVRIVGTVRVVVNKVFHAEIFDQALLSRFRQVYGINPACLATRK